MSEYKQAIVVRRDLELSPGKLGAQAAHASEKASREASRGTYRQWSNEGGLKVVLAAEDRDTLAEIGAEVRSQDVPHVFIRDQGRTELEPGTLTAAGIGPAPAKSVDRVIGDLPLY